MALQNRVTPFGVLVAIPARGTMYGNRGGRFHRDDQTLGQRRWASRQWICCVLQFKNRHHPVWRDRYTALFFLDEVTALAAGHRPCFECRRRDAKAFAEKWAQAKGSDMPRARQMDAVLQAERLGTGHAVMQAMPSVPNDHVVLVLYGDVPLISRATLTELLALAGSQQTALLTVELHDPSGYGRIVGEPGNVLLAFSVDGH